MSTDLPTVDLDLDMDRSDNEIDPTRRWIESVLVPGVRLTLWVASYLSLLLVGWVMLGVSVGGWSPVVVTSGSMEPAVSVGDVLLIDTDAPDTISQRSIVVFERADGAVIAHRVFSAEGAELVTKGDANPTPDTDRVAVADVRGVARVLVPLAGLPTVWLDRGAFVPLLAWGFLTLAGSLNMVSSMLASRRRTDRDTAAVGDVGQVGVRRVRILVAVLITAQYVLDPSRFDVFGNEQLRIFMLLGPLIVLFATNALSFRITGEAARRLPVIELAIDTVLVVFLSALTGSTGLAWVLFALPIIEAAVRFGLVGALNHWMILTSITVASRIATFEISGSVDLLGELEDTLDQMSVLFLVVVPGAYLAEQLVSDVSEQRRALRTVVDRSHLLETVADASRSVSQLDGRHIEAVLAGVGQLGFDAADIVATADGSTWQSFGAVGDMQLPIPGTEASGLMPQDLRHPAVIVDGDTEGERAALAETNLAVVVVAAVASSDGSRACLRAGMRAGRTISPGEVDAFRLLAGQASVALQNLELLSEITSMHVELEHQAHHDALTGLPNRVMFLEQLDDAVEQDALPAVMFLDLDGFKPVNDRLGHDAGDELLRLVAKRLDNAAPEGAVVARVGGDEFTMLIRGSVSEARAKTIAESVVSVIGTPFEVHGDMVRIGTSVGIAFADGDTSGAEVVRRADVAMYIAKHGAQSEGHQFYRPEFDRAEQRRALLASSVHDAIDAHEITVALQPVFRIGGPPTVAGVEALVRWNHPELGPVPPPELVEAAKLAKASALLHRHIVRSALRGVAPWLTGERPSNLFLTINASPEDLASDHLVPNVIGAVEECGADPSRVFVEISEELMSPNATGVMENIHALARAGIRMLLDDFGEGQTSISYIHELPVAGIKLDRKLVVNAVRSETDRIVVESIVELCQRLGLVVIAEGIETEQQLRVIEAVGCTLAQGFFVGMPQSVEEIHAVLRGQAEPRRSVPKAERSSEVGVN